MTYMNTNQGNIFCPSCGQKLPSDALFCTSCGNKISVQGFSQNQSVGIANNDEAAASWQDFGANTTSYGGGSQGSSAFASAQEKFSKLANSASSGISGAKASGFSVMQIAAYIAGVVALISTFLPWVSINSYAAGVYNGLSNLSSTFTGKGMGSLSAEMNLWDTLQILGKSSDGILIFIIAIALFGSMALSLVLSFVKKGKAMGLICCLGVLSTLFGIAFFALSYGSQIPGMATLGFGVALLIISSLVTIATSAASIVAVK